MPISISHLGEDEAILAAQELGNAIAEAVGGKSVVVLASTDFTHYESRSTAQARDALAIDHILNLDPAGLIHTVYAKSITMCGVIPTAVMLTACKALGATDADLLTYYTSGDVTGDVDQVVGYGAMKVCRRMNG